MINILTSIVQGSYMPKIKRRKPPLTLTVLRIQTGKADQETKGGQETHSART